MYSHPLIANITFPKRTKFLSEVEQQIQSQATNTCLKVYKERLFSLEDADTLWQVLSKDDTQHEISFKEFKQISHQLGKKFDSIFKAHYFLQFSKPSGTMSIVLFFNFAIKICRI